MATPGGAIFIKCTQINATLRDALYTELTVSIAEWMRRDAFSSKYIFNSFIMLSEIKYPLLSQNKPNLKYGEKLIIIIHNSEGVDFFG